MIDKLLLVGVNHNDLLGPARLTKLLNSYKPDSISLEITNDFFYDEVMLEYTSEYRRQKYLKPNKFNPETRDLRELYSNQAYFDKRIPKQYAQDNDIPVFCVESVSALMAYASATHERKGIFEHIKSRFFETKKVFDESLIHNVESQYAASNEEMSLIEIRAMRKRDQAMCRGIQKNLFGAALHIGGATHMYGLYENLFVQLKDFNPKRMKLNEIEVNSYG